MACRRAQRFPAEKKRLRPYTCFEPIELALPAAKTIKYKIQWCKPTVYFCPQHGGIRITSNAAISRARGLKAAAMAVRANPAVRIRTRDMDW
jgi:hypothetical protein